MGQTSSTRPPPPPERVDLVRMALRNRAPLPREEPRGETDALARTLAAMEGRLLARMAELEDDDASPDRQSRIHVEVAPPVTVEKKHWLITSLTVLAGVLAGAGALVGSIAALWNQIHQAPADRSAELQACKDFRTKTDDRFVSLYRYNAQFRSQVRGGFKALDVAFPDAKDEPTLNPDGSPIPPFELLPRPVVVGHKIGTAPLIQPSAPLAVPPKP